MRAAVTSGIVRGEDRDHVRVVASPKLKTVSVIACDASQVAAVELAAPRIRKLILVLNEALRHLED